MAGTFRYQSGDDYPIGGPGTDDIIHNFPPSYWTFADRAGAGSVVVTAAPYNYSSGLFWMNVDWQFGFASSNATANDGVLLDWSGETVTIYLTGGIRGDLLLGGGGDDLINGNAGTDTVFFSGNAADYTITYEELWTVFTDTRPGSPDGTDRLYAVEKVQFADQLVTLTPEALSGSSIVVTTLEDIVNEQDHKTSLREALTYANAHAGADTITFDASLAGGTVKLVRDMTLVLGDQTVIDGGTGNITVDGNNTFRAFFVGDAGLTGNGTTHMTIANLTIANAHAHGGDVTGGGGGGAGLGGAVFVSSTGVLTLTNVNLVDNTASGGDVSGSGISGGGGMGGDAAGDGVVGRPFASGGGGFGNSARGAAGYSQIYAGEGAFTGGASGGGAAFSITGGANGGGGGFSGLNAAFGYTYSEGGGGGGVGGGAGGFSRSYATGLGGVGGFGGGGGGGVRTSGGAGGFGGGGGSGYGPGGTGGFGGGGGGSKTGAAAGGFGGGDASPGESGSIGQGGGGAGMGGGIFVMGGGSLTITGTSSINGNSATGGTSPVNAGSGFGSGIFIHGNTAITFAPGAGETLIIADDIADQNGNGGASMPDGVGGTGASGSIVKTGAGTLVLSGDNTFTGATLVSAGTLKVDGSNANSTVTVANGAVLGGSGMLGDVSVESGGTLSPGNSPGVLNTGNLSLASGTIAIFEIEGIAPGLGGYDQVKVTGTVSLGGATLDLAIRNGFVASRGTAFTLIENDGTDAVSGTFAGLAEGALFVGGSATYAISYKGGTGNDVVVTAVNDAPTGGNRTVTATEDASFTFTVSDFAFNDSDGDDLAAVLIDTLPASGTLTLDGVAITGPSSIDIALIAAGKLVYMPPADANGLPLTSFTFRVQDDGGTSSGGADTSAAHLMTLDVTAVDDAPTLSATQPVTALKETANTSTARLIANLSVVDVDGGTNDLLLSGADGALFEIQNGDLYLKAGAKLDFETNPALDVVVSVDDASVGSTPDASLSVHVAITDVAERIVGDNRRNTLTGHAWTEVISGRAGDDTIRGGAGADTIRGGAGADVMTGGKGPDVFVFKPGDLPPVPYRDLWLSPLNGRFDLITDFKPGTDIIDLSAIDANTIRDGKQKFHFEGEGELTGSRGELVYQLYGHKPSARFTVIVGDTNGDSEFDFRIVLKGHHHLEAADFVL